MTKNELTKVLDAINYAKMNNVYMNGGLSFDHDNFPNVINFTLLSKELLTKAIIIDSDISGDVFYQLVRDAVNELKQYREAVGDDL